MSTLLCAWSDRTRPAPKRHAPRSVNFSDVSNLRTLLTLRAVRRFLGERVRDDLGLESAADRDRQVLLAAIEVRHRRPGRPDWQLGFPHQLAALLVEGAYLWRLWRQVGQRSSADRPRVRVVQAAAGLSHEEQVGGEERIAARAVAERARIEILEQRVIPRTVAERRLPDDRAGVQIVGGDPAVRRLI